VRKLDERCLVAGQIAPDDVPAIAAAGVTRIVNNRPDGEEPGQPAGAEIEAAARAAGIDYRHIPIAGGFGGDQVLAMAAALDGEGKLLAFCKSGTRSTFLWALARSERGAPRNALVRAAERAGFDLRPISLYLS
jgi:uncharacterized protein (TIGR01244 family)